MARWPHSAQNGPASAALQFRHFTFQDTAGWSALTLVRSVLPTLSPVSRVVISFPLDRGRGFRTDIVHDSIDSTHLVDDAIRDAPQHVVRELEPVSGHSVRTRHGAQRDDVL